MTKWGFGAHEYYLMNIKLESIPKQCAR